MGQFLQHLEIVLERLVSGRHFSLTRYGDGESAILRGCGISTMVANRHWCYRPEENIADDRLSRDLQVAFDCRHAAWFVGISDPCCNAADYHYYIDRLGPERVGTHTTFANIFCNGNWRFLAARFAAVISQTRRPVVVVTHWDKDFRRARHSLPYNEVFFEAACTAEYDQPIASKLVPGGFYRGGCALWYCDHREAIGARYVELARSFEGAIFLLALGPVAKILTHQMFLANPENTYLDLGHVIDGLLFGEFTRGYMLGEASRSCDDMPVGFSL
jgi:hypothetical protein